MKSIKEQLEQSNKELKIQRVNTVLKQLSMASLQNIENCIMEYRKVKIKFEQLLDMGDDTRMDIASRIRSINPQQFISDIYDSISLDLVKRAIGIKRRVNLHKKLFPDVLVPELDDNDLDGIKELFNSVSTTCNIEEK